MRRLILLGRIILIWMVWCPLSANANPGVKFVPKVVRIIEKCVIKGSVWKKIVALPIVENCVENVSRVTVPPRAIGIVMGVLIVAFGGGLVICRFHRRSKSCKHCNAVDCDSNDGSIGVGVVAPDEVMPGEDLLVQVVGDVERRLAQAIKAAKAFDAVNNAQLRGRCMIHAKQGQELVFRLRIADWQVQNPEQYQIWDGRRFKLDFCMSVPEQSRKVAHCGSLEILLSGLIVGRIGFVVNVVDVKRPNGSLARTSAYNFKNYFISYSDKDRNTVLNYVEGICIGANAHIVSSDGAIHNGDNIFFDKASIPRSADWWPIVCQYIDEKADVFVLFWSDNAEKSDAVTKEYKRALEKRAKNGGDFPLPEICPVALSRNFPPPPPELARYNFTDRLTFMRKGD